MGGPTGEWCEFHRMLPAMGEASAIDGERSIVEDTGL